MKCYELTGIINKTDLKQAIFVNAKSKEEAAQFAKTFAKDVEFVREHGLSEGWTKSDATI